MKHLTTISYGGGVQTVALTLLALQGRVARPDVVLFADTGGEREATYAYNAVVAERCRRAGLEWARCAAPESLSDALAAHKAVIPFYGNRGGMLPRVCTERWKIRVIRRALRKRGATSATVMLGISRDEIHRMKNADAQWTTNVFPLIDLGLARRDCERVIDAARLPQPPKSACVYCPYRSAEGWVALRRDDPDGFRKAVEVERIFPGLYLHASRTPLPMLTEDTSHNGDLFDEDGCTAGHCFV